MWTATFQLTALLLGLQVGLSYGRRAKSDYVDCLPGNTNLVISAPHDGTLKPRNIPERKYGCKDRAGNCQYKRGKCR